MFILVAASLVSHMGSFMTFLFFCNHQKFWCVQELEPMTQVRENCFIPRREVGEIFITKKWPVKMVRLCFCWLILKIIWYIYIYSWNAMVFFWLLIQIWYISWINMILSLCFYLCLPKPPEVFENLCFHWQIFPSLSLGFARLQTIQCQDSPLRGNGSRGNRRCRWPGLLKTHWFPFIRFAIKKH